MITKLAIRLDQIEDALAERDIVTDLSAHADVNSFTMRLGGVELEILDAVADGLLIPEDMAEAILYHVGSSLDVTESFDAVESAEDFANMAYRLLTE